MRRFGVRPPRRFLGGAEGAPDTPSARPGPAAPARRRHPRGSGGKPAALSLAVLALIFPLLGAAPQRVAQGRRSPPRPGLRERPTAIHRRGDGEKPPAHPPPPGTRGARPAGPSPIPGTPPGPVPALTMAPAAQTPPGPAPLLRPHRTLPLRCSRLPLLPIGGRRGLPANRRSLLVVRTPGRRS